MAIDAIIKDQKQDDSTIILELVPRIDSDGQPSMEGQKRMRIHNPGFIPECGSYIWGNSHSVRIQDGDYEMEYWRIGYTALIETGKRYKRYKG